MKKVLATVAAASIVAAGAPAFAADVDVSGEVRVRWEDKSTGYEQTSQRTRVTFKSAVDDQTTAVVTLQDSRVWGGTYGLTDTAMNAVGCDIEDTNADGNLDTYDGCYQTNAVDVSEAYLDLKNVAGPVSVKLGRQALAYGSQRQLGAFEWSDNARRFDGIKLTYGSDAVDVDLLLMEVAEAGNGESDEHFNAIYATVKAVEAANIQAYYFQELNDAIEQDVNTIGVRVAADVAMLKVTAEFATQGGDHSTGVEAEGTALAVTVDAKIDALSAGIEYAAAEDTYKQLHPTNHFHFGISDNAFNKWENVNAIGVKFGFKVSDDFSVKAQYWILEQDLGTLEATETNLQVKYALTDKTGLYVYAASEDVDGAVDKTDKLGVQISAKF